jgi:hypothetical protein
MTKERKIFFEDVIEKIGHIVIQSNVREATSDEIINAERLHKEGNCPHNIVYDESGWPYDFRMCHTCGASLGTV